MRRFNAYELYHVGGVLKQLESIKNQTDVSPMAIQILMCRFAVDSLLGGSPLPVGVTRQSAETLRTTLNNLTKARPSDATEEQVKSDIALKAYYGNAIQTQLQQFNTILNAEWSNLDTYWVEPKGIYSTNDLIEHAEKTFSEGIRGRLATETRTDVNEAGKCVAFDLPTAAAFHIWRAAERELRNYYTTWTGQAAGTKVWNTLIKELAPTKADPRVIAVMDHLRNLHRNPTMHPEEYLTVVEAINLFGIANSAISAMLLDNPSP